VTAVALKVLFVLLFVNCFQAVKVPFTLTQAYWGPGGSPLEEAARLSQMFDDECTQQANQACVLEQSRFFLAHPQWHDSQPWSVPALYVPPRLFILPHKLSPPSASTDDDPFLL
jgi:hypothetical protein